MLDTIFLSCAEHNNIFPSFDPTKFYRSETYKYTQNFLVKQLVKQVSLIIWSLRNNDEWQKQLPCLLFSGDIFSPTQPRLCWKSVFFSHFLFLSWCVWKKLFMVKTLVQLLKRVMKITYVNELLHENYLT